MQRCIGILTLFLTPAYRHLVLRLLHHLDLCSAFLREHNSPTIPHDVTVLSMSVRLLNLWPCQLVPRDVNEAECIRLTAQIGLQRITNQTR
jgi:hypothetical protein